MVSYDEFLEINSHIKDVNLIEPGDPVYFPRTEKTPGPEITAEKSQKSALIKSEYKKSDGSKISIYTLKVDPLKYDISVLYGNRTGLTIGDIKKDENIFAAINGGFFAPGQDFHPIGLLTAEGKKINPNTDYWSYSGVFYITEDPFDPYGICTNESYYDTNVTEAVQSFPILVWNGNPYAEYKDKEEASRSAIGIDEEGNILLIATESRIKGGLTLEEFSIAISSMEIKCRKALNLDGGSSTQMYVKEELSLYSKGAIIGEDKVSNFLVIKEK